MGDSMGNRLTPIISSTWLVYQDLSVPLWSGLTTTWAYNLLTLIVMSVASNYFVVKVEHSL